MIEPRVLVPLLLAGLAATPAEARQVLERSLLTIDARGEIAEHHRVEVLIEDAGELEQWRRFPIYLDDHRQLIDVQGVVHLPGGGLETVRKRDQDIVQFASQGVLHESARYLVLEPENLRVGARLEVEYRLRSRPYWPGGLLAIGSRQGVDRVEVEVRADPALGPLLWKLDGPSDGLVLEGDERGVRLGGGQPRQPRWPELAGGGTVRTPVLRYAWGQATEGWSGIGRWYAGLLREVAPPTPAVARLARELTAGLGSPRAKLEALVAYLRTKVRYVAVEVGVGGYRPFASGEVAARLWGDCKDKSLLLVELARAAGLEAFMVLVRTGESSRVDHEFPSPFEFNHAIAAFRAAPLEPRPGDPVAGGYFFVDPTQTLGGAAYLHGGVQDQWALVVDGDAGHALRLPVATATARRRLELEVALAADGSARGRARLDFDGDPAVSLLLHQRNAADTALLESSLRSMFEAVLAPARVDALAYQGDDRGLPTFSASVAFAADRLVEGEAAAAALRFTGIRQAPEPREIEKVRGYRAAMPAAGVLEVEVQVDLPDGFCAPPGREDAVENPVGAFRQVVESASERLVLRRRTELRQPWVLAADYGALEALALAESRAQLRRIRVGCRAPAAEQPP